LDGRRRRQEDGGVVSDLLAAVAACDALGESIDVVVVVAAAYATSPSFATRPRIHIHTIESD